MSALTKLTKDKFIPFIDVDEDDTFAANEWTRIDLSTIFELAMNPQTETMDYICYENAVEEVTANQPELPQEIALYEGNPMYDYIAEKFYNMPKGVECKVPFLLCFGGTTARAWRGICTLVFGSLSTTDGKITFTMRMGGDIDKGTFTISDGVPTFVSAEEELDNEIVTGN